MKKFFSLILAAAIVPVLLAGCGGSAAGQPNALTGVVNTDGSTSMERIMGVLTEGFRREAPGVTVNYSGTGSGSGIQAVLSGACDIGLSSRPLKTAELEKGAVAHTVALDGIALVVNPENSVLHLTGAQIAGIFTGEITNWSMLGGADAPIAVYGREAGSGTRGAFESAMGVEDTCQYTNEYSSTGDIVGNVKTNPNAIGYISLSNAGESVKLLRVDGVACTEETIRNGSYPIQRPFLLVTREGAALSGAAQAFLDYAMSDTAAEHIAIAGAVAP